MTVEEAEEGILELLEETAIPLRAKTLMAEVDQSEEDIKRAISKLVDEGELAITTDWKYRIRKDHEPNFKL